MNYNNKNSNYKDKIYSLDTVMTFSKHRGKTIKELIDTAGPNSMSWYVDNAGVKLDAEAYDYLLEGLEMYFRCVRD